MDPLGIRISVCRSYEVIPFVQTGLFNEAAVDVIRESELGTTVDISYRTLVLIEEGIFYRIAACIPDSSRCDDSAVNHDRFAIRSKVGL